MFRPNLFSAPLRRTANNDGLANASTEDEVERGSEGPQPAEQSSLLEHKLETGIVSIAIIDVHPQGYPG